MKKLWYGTILAVAALFLVVSGSALAYDNHYGERHHGYGRHYDRPQHRHVRHYHDGDYCSDPSVHYRHDYRRPARETRIVIPAPVLPLPPLPHHLLFRHWLGH